MNGKENDIAKFAMQCMRVPEGKQLDKWYSMKLHIATVCMTLANLEMIDAASVYYELLIVMEKYEGIEREGGFGK